MLLTDKEMRIVQETVEQQAGFDQELIDKCSHLIHIGAFDEAVRSAFVLLEERMRKILNKPNVTGFNMAQYAFSTDGPFTKLLAHTQSEHEGTRDLFYGAFRLYRNPAAHTAVGYEAGEARSIISLVDLLLKRLQHLTEIPQPGNFPENIERTLAALEHEVGPVPVIRMRVFLGQCMKLRLEPRRDSKQWIPFRKHALVQTDPTKPPKPQLVTLFYFTATNPHEQGLWFPVNQYYTPIVGIDKDAIIQALQGLGFHLSGKGREPWISLHDKNDQAFLDQLYDLVVKINDEFEETLKQKTK